MYKNCFTEREVAKYYLNFNFDLPVSFCTRVKFILARCHADFNNVDLPGQKAPSSVRVIRTVSLGYSFFAASGYLKGMLQDQE